MSPLNRQVGRLTNLLLTLTLIFFLGLPPPHLGAAEISRRTFALPAADAEVTLELFSEQAGAQLVYLIEDVRGVTTNPVQGVFAIRDALERLVARTGLVVMADGKTGAFVLKRERAGAAPGASSVPATSALSQPVRTTQSMKNKHPFAAIALMIAAVFAPPSSLTAADGSPTVGVVQGRVENAASGNYLGNVRVALAGGTLETLTNNLGDYRLEGVPVGPVNLVASISGYARKTAAVTVSDVPVTANFSLVPDSGERAPGEAVVLQAFVVESQRTMSGSSVALNERRTAMNLKNVVASDEFGDSAEGNVAEFVKYLPGVAIDYNNADPRYVSVRGLPSFGTAVMIDGNRMASAADNFSRGTEFNQVSLNNMAYIEVSKSPLPDTPADTIGGSINMVLKSAFERSRPVFNYRVSLNSNLSRAQDDNLVTLHDRPTARGAVVPTMPGFEFNYINPVSKNFGFTLSLLNSNQYSPGSVATPSWRPVSSGTSLAPADQPFLGGLLISDRPREGYRWSAGATLDWRLSPRDTLSLGGQWNRFETVLDYTDVQFDAVNAAVRPISYDATSTVGAPNAGRITPALTTFHKFMLGQNGTLSYRHNGPSWTLAAGSSLSHSQTYVDADDDGVIKTLSMRSPLLSVRYQGIEKSLPATISAVTSAGTPWDYASLGNYTLQTFTQGTPQHYEATTTSAFANAARWLQFAVPVKVKTGLDVRREERSTTNPTTTYTFVGPDGIANTADDLVSRYDLVARDYSRLTMPFGLGVIERPSSKKAYDLLRAHPEYFTTDDSATWRSAVTTSREFTETVAAGYLRLDTALLKNRLKLAGGVRYEHTADTGRGQLNDPGALYRRDSSGKLVLDSTGRPIRLTGTPLELTKLQYVERGASGQKDYGNFFPSLNASYSVTERLLVRSSFATTMTRPQASTVVPSTTVTDPGSTAIPTITVSNPGLKPWTAKNYDVAVEYYFEKPGLISLGAFRKDIRDFFGSVSVPATRELLAEYGFDESYLNYTIATRDNVSRARVSGLEFDYRQTITGLPEWARGLAVFANGTALRVEGDARADFSGFINRSGNWGLSLSRPRFTAKLNFNYRGRQRLTAVTGTNVPAGTYQFASPRLSTDLNFELRLTRYATLFTNIRNVLDIAWRNEIYSPATPIYARISNIVEYGPQVLLGVKGSF